MENIIKLLKFKNYKKKNTKMKLNDSESENTVRISDSDFVLTTIVKGKDEVKNKVSKGDFIITGPDMEEYSLKPRKFFGLYNIINEIVVPRPIVKQVAFVGKRVLPNPITFTSSWGESMILEPGDYLVKDTGGYYRIEGEIFKKTYSLVRKK